MSKIALCVGLNNYQQINGSGPSPLRGCINDALLIGEMLRFAGFDRVRQLHDESATQAAILTRLSNEIARLRSGDFFVFWLSGHGYQIQDRSGDELLDGLDEAVCTYDIDPRDPLIDDKYAMILARANPEAKIFIGADTCHSATGTKNMPEPDSSEKPRKKNWLPPEDITFRAGVSSINLADYMEGYKAPDKPAPPLRRFGTLSCQDENNMNHLFLSGCQADQFSMDAKFGNNFHGAMTYNFTRSVLDAWKQRKAISYQEAHKQTLTLLEEGGFTQIPSLEGRDDLKNSPVFGMTF